MIKKLKSAFLLLMLTALAGYAILHNKITKVPVFGAGAGYGVAINSKTNERTYLRMSRFDVGGGWGARSLRPLLIFQKFSNP